MTKIRTTTISGATSVAAYTAATTTAFVYFKSRLITLIYSSSFFTYNLALLLSVYLIIVQ